MIDHGTDPYVQEKKKPYIWTELGDNSCSRVKFGLCRNLVIKLYRLSII
jgi:hypothetical protein